MSRPAVPPTAVTRACTPVLMRGPATTPASTALRSDGPIENSVSGSQNEVTPARSIFVRFWPATRAAMAGSRWKKSSSLD